MLKLVYGQSYKKNIGGNGKKASDNRILGIVESIKNRDHDFYRRIGKEAIGIKDQRCSCLGGVSRGKGPMFENKSDDRISQENKTGSCRNS